MRWQWPDINSEWSLLYRLAHDLKIDIAQFKILDEPKLWSAIP